MRAPAKDTNRYFHEISEGETWTETDARTITEADIINFCGVSGDFHRAVTSKPYAEEKFGGLIAHGHLVAAVAESIIADLNPKAFTYGHDHVRFPAPTMVDDTLTVSREVVNKEVRDEEFGRVDYRYEAENDDGETVCVFDHLTMVEREPRN
ncbi:MaoC family dehydratase [Halobellus limi]|uniref:Dehydratase n=1 Tax=Halobellus limi TaxID=699433 RepID=A0A1H6BQA2_9EURY|nr:MaoC family dehydratase [Halobellus limi]QCC49407.1 dehydratase [Halobellus limi]SEG62376.1 Acyl dehydratase [Halobellus limi]